MLCKSYLNIVVARDTDPKQEEKIKNGREALVIGRSNDDEDEDFSDAMFDDVGIWDRDITVDFDVDVGKRLMGKDCDSTEDRCKYYGY